jgi:hypothetical protein
LIRLVDVRNLGRVDEDSASALEHLEHIGHRRRLADASRKTAHDSEARAGEPLGVERLRESPPGLQ